MSNAPAETHLHHKPSIAPALYWLARGVFIETLRRREISVVFLFIALFVIGAVTARFVGSESHAAAAFILNLGLSLVWLMAILLAILLSARQFPDELETRALYPLLAKPLPRYVYIIGKWLATTLAVATTLVILNGIALLASPWPTSLSAGLLIQALVLEIMAVAVIAAITTMLSIRLPKAPTIVIAGLLAFGAAPAVSLFIARFAPGTGRTVAEWIASYIPNLGRLDLLNGFSNGALPLGAGDFIARIIYSIIVILFSLGIANYLLERRSL